MKNILKYFLILLAVFVVACHNNQKDETDNPSEVKTPVTVTSVENTSISESINLNATSSYQKKNQVNSNVNGFIVKCFANVGDFVSAGKPLFIIRTKEADALSKMNKKDSTFSFKGEITVSAPSSGIITEVSKQLNDYVNDNDALAVIADQNSFVFLLNVPYELNKYATIGTSCNILLPDSSLIKGTITSKLSSMDAASQTQSYVVNAQTNSVLPENLLATVELIKSTKPKTQVIEKSAVLTDETMENFWVMKMVNDTTAVKIQVTKGITTNTQIEILSPQFNVDDKILNTGNYGLPDTAFVSINNK